MEMDLNKFVDVLKATLDPDHREQAEVELRKLEKMTGFLPALMMNVVMADNLDITVRQAGVSFFKNIVKQYWNNSENQKGTETETQPFSFEEQDCAAVRRHIVEAIIQSPDVINRQLSVALGTIIKHDYPARWTDLSEKIATYIQSQGYATWNGALMCLYQLVKVYELKKLEDKMILNKTMVVQLPLIYSLFVKISDSTPLSNLLQKQILKIYYVFIRKHISLKVVSKDIFSRWIEVVCQVVQNPVPATANNVEEDERPELPWWKVKKWAARILTVTFQRYGSPGKVSREYSQLANWYLRTFPCTTIPVLINVLGKYQKPNYIAPRVICHILNYLNRAVSYASSWKYIKPHTENIIQYIIFPLMCYSDKDDELWNTDPHEYIRKKLDLSDMSDVDAAARLFRSLAGKRRGILEKAMNICMAVLDQIYIDPRQKDGAMHMLGLIADILLDTNIYKDRIETILAAHVLPEFRSQHGYLRARAFWTLDYFNGVVFKDDNILMQAVDLSRDSLCNDSELPVRVEAAMALQMLVTKYEKAREFLRPHIRSVIFEVLRIIRETETDDLTSVFRRLIRKYADDIFPIAIEMMTHLVHTFNLLLGTDFESSKDKVNIGLGLLYSMDTMLDVIKERTDIILQLEDIILHIVVPIIQQNLVDFYEEVFSLVDSLTKTQVTSNMWQVFGMLHRVIQSDTLDYFVDMMPALYNYVTVDTKAFLSQPENLEAVYNMCKAVLTSDDVQEDVECHAAKLLEVILLQYQGQVDQVVPMFVELVVKRLVREVETLELKGICLQVCVAGLCYSPALLFQILQNLQVPNLPAPIIYQFLTSWLSNVGGFRGVHDRKVHILGLCSLINTAVGRPKEITDIGGKIIPAILTLFKGLKRAYAVKSHEVHSDEEVDSDEAADNGGELDILNSDEDEIFERDDEHRNDDEDNDDAFDDFSEGDDDDDVEMALESYLTLLDGENTHVDEYIIFKDIMEKAITQDCNWHQTLTFGLTADQKKRLKDVYHLAEQRKSAVESKTIEQGGGYVFVNVNVPSSFDFEPKGI